MLLFAHLLFSQSSSSSQRRLCCYSLLSVSCSVWWVQEISYTKMGRKLVNICIKELKDSLALCKWNLTSGIFLTFPPPLPFHLCSTRVCLALLDAPSMCAAALRKEPVFKTTSIFAFSGFVWRRFECFPKLCSRLTGNGQNSCLFITDYMINSIRAVSEGWEM